MQEPQDHKSILRSSQKPTITHLVLGKPPQASPSSVRPSRMTIPLDPQQLSLHPTPSLKISPLRKSQSPLNMATSPRPSPRQRNPANTNQAFTTPSPAPDPRGGGGALLSLRVMPSFWSPALNEGFDTTSYVWYGHAMLFKGWGWERGEGRRNFVEIFREL